MFALIIGGAASGKSAFAERLALALPEPRVYLATMQPFDSESRARVARHRASRAGKEFQTVEAPLSLETADIPAGSTVLLEDLSNLLANELFSPQGGGAAAALSGVLSVRAHCGNLIVVTNEVFSGGSDYEGETLSFLGELAWMNRRIAAQADLVAEIVCGQPNLLKGALPW